ncbi:protein FAN isoform X2 [Anabrus simplex]|uniref:protein FAN isoform X2 n=1 Tax=Anabrus simplex TaxID=316456 RepID=UPI0035A34BBD
MMEKDRFSLLLLEPGEIYFEDFSAFLFPINATEDDFEKKKELGRLKMCSKSIVFDPKDILKPIIKIPLKDCSKIFEWTGELLSKVSPQSNAIAVDCNQYVEMLEGNVLAPYIFKSEKCRFLFLLNYAKAGDCLPQFCQLHRASTLPAAEQSSMIATIVYSRQSRVGFDTLWLGDLYEKVILETQGSKITPLVVNPGRILLTSSRLYFQPYNNVEPYPVLKIRLQDIKRVIRRRFLLSQVGLEVYCDNSSHVTHLFLSLKSPADRDTLYHSLLSQSALRLENTEQEMMTLQWQNGVISNYDYLLYLNSLADRTFNDLTQYPVFPWVISDYHSPKLNLEDPKSYRDLSKPVGALNEIRLQRLKERYDEMSEPKFLYGSHYSAPGFVLFYLVRKFPHYMLCLQNGRFDHPDRMFNSVPDIWKNVLTNMSDFKEMIPAFFDTQQGGDFLVNNFGINFGYRHDGTKVGDVLLPRWAEGPEDFVKQMRSALESEYVSKNLHHWIDLIFGYKQTGPEAEKADNVFYYLCYEGAVDLESIKDINQRHALEVQIMEFGQIPKQVFTLPHPQRLSGLPPMLVLESDLSPTTESSSIFRERVHSISGLPVWKNMEHLAITSSFQSHKEAVSAVVISQSGQFVVSVGQDSLLKMYTLPEKRQVRSVTLSSMALSSCIILPDDKTLLVGSWDNSMDNKKLISGTQDGDLFLWSMESHSLIQQLPGHTGAVYSTSFSPDDSKLVSCGEDCSFKVLDLTSGMQVYTKTLDEELRCLAWDGLTLLLGGSLGTLYIWDLVKVELLKQIQAHAGPVVSIAVSLDGSVVVTGGEDRRIVVWEPAAS